MKTLSDEWEVFSKQTWPGGMTDDQAKQLRKAFFAGALVAVMLATNETLDGPAGIVRIMQTTVFKDAMAGCAGSLAAVVMNTTEGFAE